MANTQGQCAPDETVDAGWVITREIAELGNVGRREKRWAMTDPDLDCLRSGWKVGLCEKPGACLELQA